MTDELPKDWQWKTLGEVGEYINGRAFKPSEWTDHGRPIIRIQDLTGTGDQPNHYDGEVDPKHEIEAGDLLISWAATLGVYIWQGPDAVLNQHIFKVKSHVDKRFHYYLVQAALDDLQRKTHGSGMVHITKGRFEETEVPIPPPEQQRELAEALDSHFSRLEANDRLLDRARIKLDRYRASVVQAACEGRLVPTEAELARREGRDYERADELLGRILVERRARWEAEELEKLKAKGSEPKDERWKKKYKEPEGPDTSELPELPEGWAWAAMGQIAEVIGGLTKNRKRDILDSQVPYLRVANVYANELILDEVKTIGVKESELDRVLLKERDLLIVEGNGSLDQIGRVAMWDGSIDPCAHQNHLIKARLVEREMAEFVLYWLLSKPGRLHITKVASSTSGLYTLSLTKVSKLPVPLPPLSEQQRIVDAIDSEITLAEGANRDVEAALLRADRLRQSVLRKAFKGETTTRAPGPPVQTNA